MNPLDITYLQDVLPRRCTTAHKGHFGRLLILAGSTGYVGAALFCARAALYTGVGLCRMGVPEPIWSIVAAALPECMVFPLPADDKGRLTEAAFPWIDEELDKCTACLCGPGLGQSPGLVRLVVRLQQAGRPLLLDADGINNLAGHILNCSLVLTPHHGEFSRLGGRLENGSRQGGLDFVAQHPAVLVLKAAETWVFAPGTEPMRHNRPNAGLSKGGSGDVLAGIIAGLMAQGLPPSQAAAAGVVIHGEAAAICAAEWGEYSMTPSHLIQAIARVLRHLNNPEQGTL